MDQEAGVPQGSIISTTLFIVKINSISDYLPVHIEKFLYVDDFVLCYSSNNMDIIERKLAEELHQSSADEALQRLRSASTLSFVVPRTRLSTVGDRAFPVAAARLWNTLPLNVTWASSIFVFRKHFGHYNRSCYHSGNVSSKQC